MNLNDMCNESWGDTSASLWSPSGCMAAVPFPHAASLYYVSGSYSLKTFMRPLKNMFHPDFTTRLTKDQKL